MNSKCKIYRFYAQAMADAEQAAGDAAPEPAPKPKVKPDGVIFTRFQGQVGSILRAV